MHLGRRAQRVRAVGVPRDSITASEHGKRAERLETADALAQASLHAILPAHHGGAETAVGVCQPGADALEPATEVERIELPAQGAQRPFATGEACPHAAM